MPAAVPSTRPSAPSRPGALESSLLRLIHTSDWHLGHALHELPRDYEHAEFLSWLLDQLADHRADALLVAGDVFETANPSARAMGTWYRFLALARQRMPALDIVVIGGNHDSAARLEAAHPILDAFGVHVVGGLPRHADGSLDLPRLVVPLRGADGAVAAWCAAVPFLRPADLPQVDAPPDDEPEAEDPLIAGVRQVYDQVLAHARSQVQPGQALVAMGHCYMVGGALSELSERMVLGGNQHALPVDLFPDDCAYVALGHLHRAQPVGSRETVRYAGSPIPLAVDEAPYPHQVRLVDLHDDGSVQHRSLRVPRPVDVLRLPESGPAPWPQVQARLAQLPEADDAPWRWPYLEVRIRLDGPHPTLRQDVEAALQGKAARLVKLTAPRMGTGQALAHSHGGRDLSDLREEDVFRQKWLRDHGSEPPEAVLACFHELLDATHQARGG